MRALGACRAQNGGVLAVCSAQTCILRWSTRRTVNKALKANRGMLLPAWPWPPGCVVCKVLPNEWDIGDTPVSALQLFLQLRSSCSGKALEAAAPVQHLLLCTNQAVVRPVRPTGLDITPYYTRFSEYYTRLVASSITPFYTINYNNKHYTFWWCSGKIF